MALERPVSDPVRPDPEPPFDLEGASRVGAVLTAVVGVPAVLFMAATSGFVAGIGFAIALVASWIKLNQALDATAEQLASGRKRTLPETILMVAFVLVLGVIGWGMMAGR